MSVMNETTELDIEDIKHKHFKQYLSGMDLQNSFIKKQIKSHNQVKNIKKLNDFQTVMAIVKGYIGIAVLGAPKQF
jgi:hypothetical protein